jgi:hypothetical protein
LRMAASAFWPTSGQLVFESKGTPTAV